MFSSRDQRGYDQEALECFPWPVVACYDDIHRWMDQGLAVHAAWQVRDAWEALIKFLGALAIGDFTNAEPSDPDRTSQLLAVLLKDGRLSMGDWATLIELSLKNRQADSVTLSELPALLFREGKPTPLARMIIFDQGNNFVAWRNKRFGHGVFLKDQSVYAEEAEAWLNQLHAAYDACRDLFKSLTLESETLEGPQRIRWGSQTPLPFYHAHQSSSDRQAILEIVARADRGEGSVQIPLAPLLSVQRCDICGQWAAFYLDSYDQKKRRAQFLDFVEGHSQRRRGIKRLDDWQKQLEESHVAPESASPVAFAERNEPSPERFPEFLHEFEPPVYVAQRIGDFMRSHASGVIYVTGPAGVGKSWASRGLEHSAMLPAVLNRSIPALHVSLHGTSPPGPGDVKTQLSEQARRTKRWQVPAEPEAPSVDARMSGWIAALMRVNGQGELLITFDGLDELPADSGVPELFPPANELPRGCYLILTSRTGVREAAAEALDRIGRAADAMERLTIDKDNESHRAVLRSYAQKRLAQRRPDDQPPLPAEWADRLIDLAEGSFLYVSHYCGALRFGIYQDLSQLPAPGDYYPKFFDNLETRVGKDLFEGHYARVLALVAVAREPIGISHLTSWGLERGRVIVVLDDLAELLAAEREPWQPETLYRLGHETIRSFLAREPEWQRRLNDESNRLATLAVQSFSDAWGAVDASDPVDGYLLLHLLEHATDLELRNRLLADESLAGACLAHLEILRTQGQGERSLLACSIAVRVIENLVQQGRHELRAHLARAYANRGVVLGELGREAEALGSANLSLQLFWTLAVQEGRDELQPELAHANLNRALALGRLGRQTEGLESIDTSLRLFDALVRAGRGDLRPELAHAYSCRGTVLSRMGRQQEAIVSFDAALHLYEALVNQEGRQDLRSGLAKTQEGLGVSLADLGRREEAIPLLQASLKCFDALVNQGHREDLRSQLTNTYINLCVSLRALGRHEEALDSDRALVKMYQALVDQKGRKELRSDLAAAWSSCGNSLRALNRDAEAIESFSVAVKIYGTLINGEGRPDLRADLAAAYANLGVSLHRLQRNDEALAPHGAAIELYESLVHREGRPDLRPELGHANVNLCLSLHGLGRLEPMEAAYGAALALYEGDGNQQAVRDGSQSERLALASSFRGRGRALPPSRSGDAHRSLIASLRLFDALVNHEKREDLRAELADAWMSCGVVLERLQRLDGSLQALNASLAIYETLVQNEGRQELRPDLALACMNRGITLDRLDRKQEALESLAAAGRLYSTLIEQEGRAELRPQLALVFRNIGLLLNRWGRFAHAQHAYATVLGIYEQLVNQEGRAELKPELALVYRDIAIPLAAQGRVQDALEAFGSAQRLYESLIQHEGRRDLRPELANVHMSAAFVRATLGKPMEALASFGCAKSLYEALVNQEGRADLRGDLEIVSQGIAALQKK